MNNTNTFKNKDITINLKHIKKSKKKKNILLCSSAFKIKSAYNNSNIYTNGLLQILKLLDNVHEKMGIVYRVYYDDSIKTGNKNWENVINEIKKRNYCELVEYSCPQFKLDSYHTGLFGTFARFFPLFYGKKDWNIYACTDIDIAPPLYTIKEFEKHKEPFYFKSKVCYYMIPHVQVKKIDTSLRIIGSSFMSKIKFDKNLLLDFLSNIYNKSNKYKHLLSKINSNKISPFLMKRYHINNNSKESGMMYGVDEYFLNDVLLRYIIDNKIDFLYSYNVDDYTRALSFILMYNDNFKNISNEQTTFFTNFLKKSLGTQYSDKNTLYKNYIKLISIIQLINSYKERTDKNKFKIIINCITNSQKELLKVFKNETYQKYNIPEIILECISIVRPIMFGEIQKKTKKNNQTNKFNLNGSK